VCSYLSQQENTGTGGFVSGKGHSPPRRLPQAVWFPNVGAHENFRPVSGGMLMSEVTSSAP
jgi:hypothetical protein